MTDNPSGSTGQNVTTPPNAPEAGSNESSVIANIVRKHGGHPTAVAAKLIEAGFTRAHHRDDGERVARLTEALRVAEATDGVSTGAISEIIGARDAAIRERDEARAYAQARSEDRRKAEIEADRMLERAHAAESRAAALAEALRDIAEHDGGIGWDHSTDMVKAECATRMKAWARAALAGNGNGTGEGDGWIAKGDGSCHPR